MEHWYVIRSKPQKEQFLWEQLTLRNIKADLPQIHVRPVNPRAKKVKPFFPGYLFINVDFEKMGYTAFQSIPGSTGLIMFGGEAASIPDPVWLDIHQHLAELNTRRDITARNPKKGSPVWIREGPLCGYQAIFDMRLPDTERVRVLIRLVRDQQIRVELPAHQLEFAEYSYK